MHTFLMSLSLGVQWEKENPKEFREMKKKGAGNRTDSTKAGSNSIQKPTGKLKREKCKLNAAQKLKPIIRNGISETKISE